MPGRVDPAPDDIDRLHRLPEWVEQFHRYIADRATPTPDDLSFAIDAWLADWARPNPALQCRCTRTPPVSCEAHRGTLRQRQHAPVLERNEAGDATECIVCGEPGRTAAPGFAPMCETCEGTI